MKNSYFTARIRTQKRVVWTVLTTVALALLLAGCGGGGSSDNNSSSSGGGTSPGLNNPTTGTVVNQPNWTVRSQTVVQPTRKWTILVYMNGANNLETYSVLNTNQMESVGSTADVNIVVQWKRIAGYDSSNGDWTDTRRYYITKDTDKANINSLLISQQNSLDMGNAGTLKDFITWGTQAFPAQHYAIFLWNHGAGWRSQKIPSRSANAAVPGRGFSYDDVTSNHIDTIQLPAALDLGNGRKWDVLAWDSSLMQMAEVSYEIRNQASYIVGSEESPPGTGYPYDLFLGQLVANPDKSPRDFAISIAQNTLSAYTDSNYQQTWGIGSESGITQSVLDTSQIAAIAPAMNNLGSALLASGTAYNGQILSARSDSDSYAYPNNKDLLDYCRILSVIPDNNIKSAVSQVQTAVGNAVIYSAVGTGHANSKGLAIYVPSASGYTSDDITQANGFGQRYSALSWAKAAPNWQSFLVQGP